MSGIELTMVGYTLTLDYKPNFNMIGRNPWVVGQTAISARAVIVKQSTLNKRKRKKARAKRREEREERVWLEWRKK